MRARALTVVIGLCLSGVAFAQQGGGMSRMPAGPEPVTLTSKDVERLLKVLPSVAREGAKFSEKNEGSSGLEPGIADSPEMKKIEAMLAAEGLTMMDFAMQMATLVSTYLALSPDAFEEQIPSEKSPEMQRVLKDPSVPKEQKDALREQIKYAQQNKEELRSQLTALATEENKRVVRPYLDRVKKALDDAQSEAKTVEKENAEKAQ